MARRVIVTGGFGVLGRAVAQAFAGAGDRVARIDHAPLPGDAGPLDRGGVDLADAAAAAQAVADVGAALGGLDVLVNVAGGFVWQPLAEGGPQAWSRMFAINALTALGATHAALPLLQAASGAAIICVGAGAAQHAGAGMGAYAASKSAVHRLVESLAAELAGSDCTVNAVLPSIIDTPANRADMPDADTRQWVRPETIADVVVFLASPQARGINGALIPVTRRG